MEAELLKDNKQDDLELLPAVDKEESESKVAEEEVGDVLEEEVKGSPKACEDDRFTKYFKMLHFGVPVGAVKRKMEIEGLDSSILE